MMSWLLIGCEILQRGVEFSPHISKSYGIQTQAQLRVLPS